ncbi:MAG: alkaline shock response membrane anchor protein AmaP [Limnochordia bacterium]|jgi:uncharacterized alkaline shock family protein YloU|nr:alkaline shock response membrane anchor protein AmaP [Bacillota bacterium]HOB08081.1 alkaline shock response membrane anchor protein AmaP [Limnochordia bacterium]MDI9469850.1 alkaline shock response membrane anchor protein AmaP [Bacillota bacterium]NLH32276.1 alkaline shock response membrane anchor protein AmaP [Bacillota bacterium]HPT92446.1 alkaline shock response membrane anchor protein AmaP [Limnochordia bacterium]
MAVLDRIILSVVIVVLLVMGVLAAATTFGNNMLLDWLIRIQTVKLDGFLLVLIMLLLALYLVLMLVNELKTDKRAIVSQTPLGDVRINIQTISGLVYQAVRAIEGVKDAKVSIGDVQPLQLNLKLQLLPDYQIPQLAETVQASIRDYLQQIVGIEVAQVNVTVFGVLSSQEPKTS